MEYKNILLTGSSGTLGQRILGSNEMLCVLAPSRKVLDITKPETIQKFFEENKIDAVIHCAAMARMKECHEKPAKAIETNVVGTSNLVMEVIKKEEKTGKQIRVIHMSTDGVYQGIKGNYKEDDVTIPYNFYGWTKLGSECAVRLLKNYCIIRTNFFDPKNIRFMESATDAFTSKVTVDYIAKAVLKMLKSDFIGVINIGKERKSDYENYKEFKPELKPCKLKDILKTSSFLRARDSSMDIGKWKKIDK